MFGYGNEGEGLAAWEDVYIWEDEWLMGGVCLFMRDWLKVWMVKGMVIRVSNIIGWSGSLVRIALLIGSDWTYGTGFWIVFRSRNLTTYG